ncbi:MAG: hypothetical protein ACREL5_11500, partial [Gemmatimonadales bacterium]
APDHPKLKTVSRAFERIAEKPGFRFLGNVEVGRDIGGADLARLYDAVIYAVGAATDRHLGIAGEDLGGSHSATEFVGWYNGHPEYVESRFDLAAESAAIVGIGNVAMDIARILTTDPDHLATTDLAPYALNTLRGASVRTLHILSRRGPVQAACTTPELRELGEIEGVDVLVDPADLSLDPVSAERLAGDDRNAANNLTEFRRWAERGDTGASRRIVFHFCVSPIELSGTGKVEKVHLVRNHLLPDGRGDVRAVATDEGLALPAGLVFRSIGYRAVPIEGVPFDARRGVVPNAAGRVLASVDSGVPVPGLYVTGWIKRGPEGVIGTNKACAAETVSHLLADAEAGVIAPAPHRGEELDDLLARRNIRVVDWTDWQAIDRAETTRGAPAGRPREKFTSIAEMLEVLPRPE